MIDYILWVGVTILQIVNIVVLIKQHKMIDELNGEIEELRDDNVWYNNRFKAVARHCGELRDRIEDAKQYLNTTPIKKEHKVALLRLLEDKNSTSITLNSNNMNITYTKEG